MSNPKRYNDLPEEVKRRIYSHLPMKERMRIRRVSKEWHQQTIAGVTRLVVIPIGWEHHYGPLLNWFHFARHHRVRVTNAYEIYLALYSCLQLNRRLDSVKFVEANLNAFGEEVMALQGIGELLAGVTELELERCSMAAPHQLEVLVPAITNLVYLALNFAGTVDGMHVHVITVLNNNPNIKHFKLRDTLGQYPEFQISQALISFHVALRSRNVDENLWISLRNNSGRTLRVYKSEFFDGVQEKYLAFENLEDLRLANIREQLSQAIIPSRQMFPKLRVLALRFENCQPNIADVTWLFEQHQNLEILDIGVWFRNQNTLERIADSCPRLQHLSLYVDFDFTNFGAQQLLRMTNLRQLHLYGEPNRMNDEHLVQVVPLPHLRALRVNCVTEPTPVTEAAFRQKALADRRRLYFLSFGANPIQEELNVLQPSNHCSNFFYSWGDRGPFGLFDYRQWERINRRMLNNAFGLHQKQ